ncbi:MAG: tetratricopeptide repeat protein [Marinilabiliales bacterium]|nr:MAG: tetratricopeptide repeat protein [Marinilabiliales bacterium]
MAKKHSESIDGVEVIESSLSRTEQFIEDNQKTLTIVVVVILAIVGAYLGYNKYYIAPLEEEAEQQVFAAEQYFEKDSFRLALNGDGNYLGFEYIADEYSSTKTGNLANYYAGICCLKLGQYDEAIDYLENFSSDDKVVSPMALAAIGDAYSEKQNFDQALNYYMQAVDNSDNTFTAPTILLKAGIVAEKMGNFNKAIDIYERIKEDYPKSFEGNLSRIEKYITRAKVKGSV